MPFDLDADPPPLATLQAGAVEMTHEIHVAADDGWRAMAALGAAFAATSARLVTIQGATPARGRWAAAVRVAGVTPDEARALTDQLAASGAVSTAHVEHVLWTTKVTP